jgi:hypothetical protein
VIGKNRNHFDASQSLVEAGDFPDMESAEKGPGRTSAAMQMGMMSLGFAALGTALMLVGDDATAASRFYTSTPEFKVWAALTVAVIGSLPAVWRVGVDVLRRLGLDPRRVLRSWAAPTLVGVVLVVIAAILAGEYARGNGSPYYDGTVRVGVIYVLSVTAAVPAFLAMWVCFRQLAGGGTIEQGSSDGVRSLLLLRECLLSALTTVGLLVSAGVLTVGAERQAALADAKHAAPYPSAYVLIWGLSFSAVLVVNFLPAFRRLTQLANSIIDTHFPILSPASEGWQKRMQERKDLAELLKVTSGAKDVITSAILVAGPLISSAFSLFLPSSSK